MYGNRPRNNFNRGAGPTPPVKVGDELDVTIEAVGEKGDGIAKKNGFVIFIPNVKAGQQVRIKVTRVLRKVGFAEVVGASAASSDEESSESETTEETEQSSDDSQEQTDDSAEGNEDVSEENTEDFGEEEQQ